MKTFFLRLALALSLAPFAAPARGQSYPATNYAPYRAPIFAPPAAPAPVGQAPGGARPRGYGMAPQHVAMQPRPQLGAPPIAPSHAVGPSFRPINPPSATSRRMLTASRAPAMPPATQTAAKAAMQPVAPPAQPLWQPSMNSQGWSAPTPSMPGYTGGGYQNGGFAGPAPTGNAPYYNGAPGYDAPPAPAAGPAAPPVDGYVGNPAAAPAAPAGDAIDYSYGGVTGSACGGCEGGAVCGRGWLHGCHDRGCCCLAMLHECCCCIPCCSTGDLVQHMPFFGTTHGYYYFRPYHVMHVFSQQELATRWGGDARNPYDNSMFEKVYQELGVAARPTAVPVETTLPSIETTVPTIIDEQTLPSTPTITPAPSKETPTPPTPGMSITPAETLPTPAPGPVSVP